MPKNYFYYALSVFMVYWAYWANWANWALDRRILDASYHMLQHMLQHLRRYMHTWAMGGGE